MNNIVKYRIYRKDAKEYGEVLYIDYENNLIGARFTTNDGKYHYEKSYDINSNEIEITKIQEGE